MNEDAAPITLDLRTRVSDVETIRREFFTYTIVSDPAAAEGDLRGAWQNGTYTFDSADDFNGTATFTFYVTDRGDPDACSPVSTSCSAALTQTPKRSRSPSTRSTTSRPRLTERIR